MRKPGLIAVLALLAGGSALVMLGKVDRKTDLSAVMEMWGDVLRDADQATLRATRVSDQTEMALGRQIRGTLPPDDPKYTAYVNAVGQELVPFVRRTGISYQFHVIDNPEINAFSLPGGQIVVCSGLMDFLRSEAELAAVLGHEISHVDLRHVIERYQYELAARKVGIEAAGQIADLARLPFVIGYQQYQEIEADEQGTRLSIEAGYDPTVAPVLFTRMQQRFNDPEPQKPTTPQAELAQMMSGVAEGYLRTHPLNRDRAARLNDLIAKDQRQLKGQVLYVGVNNVQQLVPRRQQRFPGDERRF